MKNELQTFTEELVKNEPAITVKDLLEEIKQLLDDYFIGEICFSDDAITYLLPNGQKFMIIGKSVT